MCTFHQCNFWNLKDQFRSHPKLTIFHILLCVVSLGSLACIIIALGWKTSGIWGDYKFWAECLYGSLTLLIISYNLMKFIDVETIKGLSDLRRQLNEGENKKVHSRLMQDSDKTPILLSKHGGDNFSSVEEGGTNVDLFNYLGTIELGGIMLLRGVISLDEFYNQFGYRIQNIACDKSLMDYLHSEPVKQYYTVLLPLIEKFSDNKYL